MVDILDLDLEACKLTVLIQLDGLHQHHLHRLQRIEVADHDATLWVVACLEGLDEGGHH